MIKFLPLSLATTCAVMLAGCASESFSNARLSSMSCTDLAREIGRYTQMRDDADADSLVGTIDMVIADNREDEIVAGAESIIGDITSAGAERELSRLQSAYVQRGCY